MGNSGLSALPFGSLRKAQRTLAQATMETDDEDDDADENDNGDSASDAPAPNDKPAQEWSTRKRTDIAKRAHKHA
jgi:ribosomal RNA-processing protein 36